MAIVRSEISDYYLRILGLDFLIFKMKSLNLLVSSLDLNFFHCLYVCVISNERKICLASFQPAFHFVTGLAFFAGMLSVFSKRWQEKKTYQEQVPLHRGSAFRSSVLTSRSKRKCLNTLDVSLLLCLKLTITFCLR